MVNLIIGGTGLVGTSLAEILAAKGEKVILVDNFRSSNNLEEWRRPAYDFRLKKALAGAELIELDVRDAEGLQRVIRETQPDVVFYLAALLASESTAHPDYAREVQMDAFVNTIRYMEEGTKDYKFVSASSSYIYGNFVEIPATENHPLQPLDTYGRLKVEAESFVKSFDWKKGRWTVLRPSSVYGVGDPRKRYATLAVEQAVAGRPVELTYPDFICDFSYVNDVAEAFALAGSDKFVPETIFNVTYGEAHTNGDFINTMKEIIPNLNVVTPEVKPVIAPVRGALDSSLARRLLGWQPKFNMRAGILDALNQAEAAYGRKIEERVR